MSKQTVIILGKIPPPYMGPAIATQILLQSSLNENFELVHVDTRAYDDLTEIGQWSIKKLKRNYRIYSDLIHKIKTRNPELVLIPISQSTVGFIKDSVFILIATWYKKRTLLHLRGSDFRRWYESAPALIKAYTKRMLARSSGVIVLGNNLKQLFGGLVPEDRIYVAPNGGDYTLPAPEPRSDDKIRLVYLGNLQPSKGIEDVIEAAVILNEEHKGSFQLDVIGGWRKEQTRTYCEGLVAKHSLPVVFHPQEKSKEKFRFLRNADIFLFPPREPEGHPWVIVEAMACGLPVISTDRGAIIESVTDGENGFIVPTKNASAIAEKAALLINNQELRSRMGAASRTRYEADFTERRMTGRLTDIFRTVMNKSRI